MNIDPKDIIASEVERLEGEIHLLNEEVASQVEEIYRVAILSIAKGEKFYSIDLQKSRLNGLYKERQQLRKQQRQLIALRSNPWLLEYDTKFQAQLQQLSVPYKDDETTPE